MILLKRLLSYFKSSSTEHSGSASVAKDRLQIIVSHQRSQRGHDKPDYLDALENAIIETIRKHIAVDDSAFTVSVKNGADGDKLELNIELPNDAVATPSSHIQSA